MPITSEDRLRFASARRYFARRENGRPSLPGITLMRDVSQWYVAASLLIHQLLELFQQLRFWERGINCDASAGGPFGPQRSGENQAQRKHRLGCRETCGRSSTSSRQDTPAAAAVKGLDTYSLREEVC